MSYSDQLKLVTSIDNMDNMSITMDIIWFISMVIVVAFVSWIVYMIWQAVANWGKEEDEEETKTA